MCIRDSPKEDGDGYEVIAGQRATVKTEMNGFTPSLDRRPPPRWMGGQGGQSLKVLGRALSDLSLIHI